MTTIIFTIPGPPVPKARPKFGSNRRTGARQTYTPTKTAAYEKKVKALALLARQKARQRVWTGPVSLDVLFYVHNPQAKPDISNLLKSIEDACIGVIYRDDAQITHLWARKKATTPVYEGAIVTFSKDEG